MSQPLTNPPPLFLDQHGALLDAGSVYIGTAGDDPQTSPIIVYLDAALTIPIAQPLKTRGGVIVNAGQPVLIFMAEDDYSLRYRDADGNQVAFFPNCTPTAVSAFQPLSAVLTAVAAVAATPFGISVLTAADAAALRTLAGIASALSLSGGTMTGNILRASAGPHLYHTNGAFTSGRLFVTPNTDPDPTSQDGDIWLKYAP